MWYDPPGIVERGVNVSKPVYGWGVDYGAPVRQCCGQGRSEAAVVAAAHQAHVDHPDWTAAL